MRIAITQINVKPLNFSENIKSISKYITKARASNCDVIIFPEMCISGYFIGDKWQDDSFCFDLIRQNEKIINLAGNITVIWGNLYLDKDLKRFSAAYIFQNGQLEYRLKRNLSNYRFFDDARYFQKGDDNSPVQIIRNNEICNVEILIGKDQSVIESDLIINIAANPLKTKEDNKFRATKNQDLYYYVNCTGVQNNGSNIIPFYGNSGFYDSHLNKILKIADSFAEGFAFTDVDLNSRTIKNINLDNNVSIQSSAIREKYNAIIKSYQYMFHLLGDSKLFFGLSGGIDSSLNATLATLALGKESIVGYNLVSDYNSKATIDLSKKIAENLDIKYHVLSIKPFLAAAHSLGIDYKQDEQNYQSRIRGLILQTLASINKGVVVCNANKIELFAGYCTYLGDTIGAFAPIGDLTKLEIFEMSKFINNEFGNIIPSDLLPDSKMNFIVFPSAELKDNQKDPFWWGVDDYLVECFCNFINPEDLLIDYKQGITFFCNRIGFDLDLLQNYAKTSEFTETFIKHLEWLWKLFHKNCFKRIQFCPVVILSDSSFGFDFREALLPEVFTDKYKQIKKTLLDA